MQEPLQVFVRQHTIYKFQNYTHDFNIEAKTQRDRKPHNEPNHYPFIFQKLEKLSEVFAGIVLVEGWKNTTNGK